MVEVMNNEASRSNGEKRVTILYDSWNHMMPALAREMVRRNHDLVLGDARDEELVKELLEMGAKCPSSRSLRHRDTRLSGGSGSSGWLI